MHRKWLLGYVEPFHAGPQHFLWTMCRFRLEFPPFVHVVYGACYASGASDRLAALEIKLAALAIIKSNLSYFLTQIETRYILRLFINIYIHYIYISYRNHMYIQSFVEIYKLTWKNLHTPFVDWLKHSITYKNHGLL